MNKPFYAIIALVLFPLVAQAFPGLGAEEAAEHRQKRLEHITQQLNLSETQQQQVEQLWQQQREKFAAIHQETQAGMQEILDAEQFAKLNSCKHERHGHGKPHGMGAQ